MVMQVGVQSDWQSGAAPAADIDLGALRHALWRKKFLILGLTLLAAATAFAGVNLVTPRYKSEARVLIEMRENIFFRPDAEKTTDRGTTVDQEAVTSQVQLILSRDLAGEVIKKLNLGERPEFDPVLGGPNLLRSVLSLTGIIKDPLEMTPEERVYKSYYDRLSAFQVEKSRVIAIEFESQDPLLAAQVANAVADTYLRFQQAAKQDQTRAAGAWLAGEIQRLRANLAQAEAKVEQYRSKTNLFIGNNNTTLSNQQLGDFNGQLATARAQKADAEAKAKLIRDALKAGSPIEFSDITNSELLRRLSEQRVTLRAQLAEQSSTLLDRHPRIKELRAQIADLERQMRAEADRLARSLENDAKLASSKVDEFVSALDQLKRQAASTNEQDVQLRALERDAKSQRDLLESYLAKFREASARDSIGAAAPDARIISTAAVSTTPAWPKKLPIILVAALAMFTLSSVFIMSSELLRSVTTQVSVPFARSAFAPGSAPADANRTAELLAAARAMGTGRATADVRMEALERLAKELDDAGEGARRITVIGTVRNVGTTMTAIALARRLAGRSRVVLVELAVASPNLSVIASEPSAPGLSELVAGSVTFGQIITRDRHSRAHLIMAGRAPVDAVALMESQRLAIAIEALGRSYDHVVLDAGVVEEVPLDRFAILAPRAVLVAADLDDPATAISRARLLKAGFANVSVLVDAPSGPDIGASGSKAAA
jgi:polysaccharide biosynthesis transport protein